MDYETTAEYVMYGLLLLVFAFVYLSLVGDDGDDGDQGDDPGSDDDTEGHGGT